MSLNAYTAQKLYENGILDYVPMDVISGPMIGAGMNAMNGQQYLNYAMQGNLYNSYGCSCDSFTSSNRNYINLNSTNIGTKSNVATNAMGFFGIGHKSTAGANGFGVQGIGDNSTAGANGFGLQGIGNKSNISFESSFGGFADARNATSDASNKISSIPKPVWGILSLIIGGVALASMFKGKKKPPVEKTSFWSRLNPFKKSK